MKKIKLTKGYEALVDDDIFLRFGKQKWQANIGPTGKVYARGKIENNYIYLHKAIMPCPKGKQVDHIDGNSLNNKRSNLRVCTVSENCCNTQKRTRNKSGYKGVTKYYNRWIATVRKNGESFYLGTFSNKIEAYKAYCKKAEQIHGEFANLN